MALLNMQARSEIEAAVRRIEKIETAVESGFQDHFVRAMAFPHKTDPYPQLSAAVTLPERSLQDNVVSEDSPRRRRTRRRG